VLKHDGIKLLFMIRLCPLPFSITNGMLASIPTVTPLSFFLATAAATPKLLLHIWVGAQMAALADAGETKADWRTKLVSYIGIAIASVAGAATGYYIWVRTKRRAEELAAMEAEEEGRGMDSDEEALGLVEEYEDLDEDGDVIRLGEAEYVDRLVAQDELELPHENFKEGK
jgi:hypothetical protein